MKLAAALVVAAACALPVLAAEPPAPASPAREAFERLKGLAGTWAGSAVDEGGKPAPVTVVYKVTAAGSAVEETLFPGTPHEMVTMYHLDGDRLALTHYCAAGNQPHMELQPTKEANVLSFRFVSGTNMKESDLHMHTVCLTLADGDHFKGVWRSMKDGKPAGDAVFELARQK
jgi:hypothetical protein